MIVPIPYVHLVMGLVMAALSVPLILRKVPMNRAYGIRTRKAFASESNWFAINAFGGRLFLGLGLFLVVFGYFGGGLAPGPTSPWAPAFLIVPLLGLVPVLVLINAFSRRLPDR